MRWANVGLAATGIALLASGVNGAAVRVTSTVYEYADCTATVEGATAATGVSSNDEVAVSSASGPQVTLLPAVHWDHNSSDIGTLKPCDGATLYYAETPGYQSPYNKSQFAHVTTNFSSPSVILDGTIHIQDITCSALSSSHETNMRITFASQQAYAFAESAWKSLEHLVLVTFHAGCGSASDTRIFWAVETLDFGPGGCTCVEAKAVELEFADCVTDLDVEWGTYTPPSPPSKSFPVGGSGSSGSRGSSGSSGSPGSSGSKGSSGPSGSSGSKGSSGSSGSPGSSGSGPFTNGTTSGTNGTTSGTNSTGTYTSGTTSGTNSTGSNTNGTSSGTPQTSNSGSCGVPPSSTIDGFPTAPCGDDFDQTLDDEIGYFDWDDSADDSSDANDFIPDDSASGDSKKRAMHKKRGFWSDLKNTVSDIGSDASSLLHKAGDAIGTAVSTGVTLLGDVKDAVTNGVSGSLEKDMSFDYVPGDLIDSPFGQAVEIYNTSKQNEAGTLSGSLTVYCVDCEFKSSIAIVGKITAGLTGITAGSVGMSGTVHAGIGLGLDAQVEYKDTFTKQLTQATIPELTVPGVIAVGPIYTISAELDLDAKAEGQLLAGIAMDITNFAATLDLLDSSKSSSSGFTPTFTKTFTASGEIDVSAILSLPIDIGVGITIPLINWKKTIGMIEKPGVNATASFTGSTDPAQLAGMSCPNGISWDVSLTNDVSLDFFGLDTIDLFPYTSPPLISGCYQLGGSSNATQASGGSASPTQTSAGGSSDGSSDATPTPTSGGDSGSGDGSSDGSATTDGSGGATPTPTGGSDSDSGDGSSDGTATTDGSTGATPTSTDGSDGSDGSSGASPSSTPTSSSSSGDGSGDDYADSDEDDFEDGDGYVYISIADTTKTYSLTADDDGNFYLDNYGESDSYYELFGTVATTDDTERIFHFYNDTMSALGVSRFRLSYEDQIPKTAQLASLVALDYDDTATTPSVFVAADLAGNVYYTVACTIADEYTKIFLVSDVEAGIATLKKPELMYTVTGGVVSDCSYMPFTPIADAGSKVRRT